MNFLVTRDLTCSQERLPDSETDFSLLLFKEMRSSECVSLQMKIIDEQLIEAAKTYRFVIKI